MTRFRWLGVAMLTLATTGAVHAQTASFAVLGLTSLFGGDVEELPAAQHCEINMLPIFVTECLTRWQELWSKGNYKEAEKLANIASRLDPTNPKAQHARVLSEIMQMLADNQCHPGLTISCQQAGCCAATGAAQTSQTAVNDSKTRQIEQCLREPIGCLSFRDTPLRQVIDDLRTLSGINIVPDYRALQEANICLDTPVTLSVQKLSLRSALNILLDQAKLTYAIENQVLTITTPKAKRGGNRVVTYQVEDLVEPNSPVAAALAQQFAKTADKTNASVRSNTTTGVEDLLICLIQNTVAADTWKDVGGQGTIQYFPLGKALVVNQTQDVQEDVQVLLESLRRLKNNPANADCPCPAIGRTNSQVLEIRAITGLTPAGTLTSDLGIPIRPGIDFPMPPFGGFPGTLGADGSFSMGPIIMMHPFQGMPMPPPARGLGVVTNLPTPAQAMFELECVRQAAMENAKACCACPAGVCAAGTCAVAQPMPPVAKHKVHLVTPQMEAYCERITNDADTGYILLEGDVELTYQRDGQTTRIQAQRIRWSERTFTAESMPEPARSETRVRVFSPQGAHVQPATYSAPVVPWQMYRPVPPTPYIPDFNRFKPEE